MNGYLGRDKIWNEQIWNEIDKAAREQVGRIRVGQKVFPSTTVNNTLPVSTTRSVPFGLNAVPLVPPVPGPDFFQPFFEISNEFVLTQEQVDSEQNMHLASSFASLAASAVADAEDTILFLGPGSILPLLVPLGVNVTNQPPGAIPPQFASIPPGFVAEAANYPPFTVVVGATGVFVGNILAAVAVGMAALNNRAQPGPYALLLSPLRYAQTFEPPAGLLTAPGDQINHVVTGGVYMVNRLAAANLAALPFPPPNPDLGILVSLGGEPAKIILSTEMVTAFTQTDAQGNYHFRVFERIQMAVRDGRAFQTLTF
jgi:uncharacterized linocin/CFP29 family protein